MGLSAFFLINTSAVNAQTTYNYTGTIETYTVPAGVYSIQIQAKGAEGGEVTNTSTPGTPGKGADMTGTFSVTPGQVLNIMVGEKPPTSDRSSGGGGGSFVWDDATTTLFIAAGGGGGACAYATNCSGADAVVTENATNGLTQPDGGGTAGNGATLPTSSDGWGGGGAGWNSDGNVGSTHGCTFTCTGGQSPLSGGAGGSRGGSDFAGPSTNERGGFGGGGGGNGKCGVVGAGGGGGYSGGGSGGEYPSISDYNGGGGGGSFNAGTDQVNVGGSNTGHGQIIITELCAPLTTSVSGTELCEGDLLTLSATSATGGTVTWDGGVTDGVAFEPTLGTTTYTATSDSPEDCPFSVDITVNENPVVEAGTDVSVCEGETVTLTGSGTADTYIWSGGAMDGVPFIPMAGTNDYFVEGTISATGCSSTDVVSVTYLEVDETISVSGGTLTSNHTGITYQWVECPTYAPIPGATNQSYTPSNDGDYAVIVTNGGCSDTSACETIVGASTDSWTNSIKIYPNPSTGIFQIQMDAGIDGSYTVFTSDGKEVLNSKLTGTTTFNVDLTNFENGTYIFVLTSEEQHYQIPLIKQ